jgi:hypothetical protein
MSEMMDCEDCGGSFLEDYASCTCKDKEIERLKKELRTVKRRLKIALVNCAISVNDASNIRKTLENVRSAEKKAKRILGRKK